MTDLNQLKAALTAGPVTIWFTKVNGHKRTMVCTLAQSALPPANPDTDAAAKSNKTRDPNLLVVFDIQMHGWRSIKVDSISKWEIGEVTEAPVEVTPPTIGWTPGTNATPTPV